MHIQLQYPDLFLLNPKSLYNDRTFLVYGELFSNAWKSHRDYLQEICESDDILPFFKCLYQNRGQVIFAYSNFRVISLEMYFKEVYQVDVNFKLLDEQLNKSSKVQYSYTPDSYKMNYYVFDDSFQDVE